MQHAKPGHNITNALCATYAAPAPILAAMGTTFYVFLHKFYSDVCGVPLAALSLIVVLSRVWDALIDPAVGHLSDRTNTRWGRRRPWIVLAALPLAATFVAVMTPPAALSPAAATAWLAIFTFLMFIAWTAIVIPYEALGPELTFDYDARNRLYACREGAMILGTVLAAIMPEVIRRLTGSTMPGQERLRFMLLGLLYALLLLPAVGFSMWLIRERGLQSHQRPQRFSRQALRTVWNNRPFRILLTAYAISALGSQLPATLILYYVEYVLESAAGGLFLLLYLVVGFAFIPLWIALAKRFEKRQVWLSAMALNTGAFAGVILLDAGDMTAYAVLILVSALGLGGTVVIPASMEADVIDLDELQTGSRREGIFSGIWSICRKLAAALGAGLGLAVLDAAGYTPGGRQPESAVFALRILYAGVPCLCNAVAIVIAWRYPLNRREHQSLRQTIEERLKQPSERSENVATKSSRTGSAT